MQTETFGKVSKHVDINIYGLIIVHLKNYFLKRNITCFLRVLITFVHCFLIIFYLFNSELQCCLPILKSCFMQTKTPGNPFFFKDSQIWEMNIHFGRCLRACSKLSCEFYKQLVPTFREVN